MGLIPSGVTGYTSLQRLEGLTTATDFGAGVHHFDYLAQEYPTSVLVLGFYAVNFLDPIVEGRAEGRIEKFLDYLERHDRPLYLRFGYEFDGPWNYYEPEKFKLAWRVSYEKMKERGIDHTAMVWQSSTHCAGTYKDLPLTAWYPGDEYVDWIGLSYFMPEECDAEPVLDLLQFAREHQKPVMIAESTPQGYDLRESTFSLDGHEFVKTSPEAIWDQWYQPYFDLIYSHSDVIRAVAYINVRWQDQQMWGPPYSSGYWGDSRVQASDLIAERWKSELLKDKWLHAGDDLFSSLSN
jgi:hypothetical protein